MAGGYLQRLRQRLGSLHRPAKIAYALLFTVGPALAAYFAIFAPGGGGDTDAEGAGATSTTVTTSPTTSASTATTVPPVDDPYLYANFEGMHPSRIQECDGLLGLCLGQPIDIALQMFGPDEDVGYPQAVTPDEYTIATQCHRWSPPRFEGVTVCDLDGAIVSVVLGFSSEATFALALPRDFVLRFPDFLATSAAFITKELGDEEPFLSVFIQAENEDIAGFDWFLPIVVEGPPETVLRINGRQQWTETVELPPCTPEGASYRYQDVAAVTTDMLVETVGVARTAPADLAEPECG